MVRPKLDTDSPIYRPFRVLVWTTVGPMACTLIALFYTMATFAELGHGAYTQALVNAIILPLGLGIPLFAIAAVKYNALKRTNEDLARLAATDGLTACLNRSAFVALIDEGVGSGRRPAISQGALLILDADNFKSINDRFGHRTGDEALVEIARTIRANVRKGDIVGRLGGEEFGVFLPGVELAIARQVAERIRRAVAQIDFQASGASCPLSISIGGIMYEEPTRFEDLFAGADRHLYAAKDAGRNRVLFTADIVNGTASSAG